MDGAVNTDTEQVDDVLYLVFEECPICGKPERVTMPILWKEAVENGAAIRIVGCGNPWHYLEWTRPTP